ncbi:fumarylacetoacetate hydrolase family protein [Cadophora sp. DSE1049]|nr:fumarylacetoacetate hydrolase family protein [Cadophora sp. DSE1049]
MASSSFKNLIRFLDDQGQVCYGDVTPDKLRNIIGSTVAILNGDVYNLEKSEQKATVVKLLSPLPETPIFICIGLNYAAHANEANLSLPTDPVIFIKPSDALAGPYDEIPIPKHASLMDYEGELCIIIGKKCKNVTEADALDVILGYTVGNDLSSRLWQRPPRSGGQFCYAKSFDRFAPLGPSIATVASIDPASLHITTKVNGEVRQDAPTSDMLFSVQQIVAHASRGTTLQRGTVIMTGTPSGIAAKMKGEPWLKDGDVVEVEIGGLGALRNTLRFEN